MRFIKEKDNKKTIEKYPEKIRKSINYDGRLHRLKMYEYELVKIYPRFALYQNSVFPSIKETISKDELKDSNFLEIISEGEFFESEFYDIWE